MESNSTNVTAPRWHAFNQALLDVGLDAIEGLPDDLIEWIRLEAPGSDLLWVESAEEQFSESFLRSPVLAVDLAHEQLVEAVRSALRDLPFPHGSEGWAFSSLTGQRLNWGESINQLRGTLDGWARLALIAAAEADHCSDVCCSTLVAMTAVWDPIQGGDET